VALALPVIDRHIDFISELAAQTRKRTKKTELEIGFTEKRDNLEHIIYFYCHGRGSSDAGVANLTVPGLVLTDDAVTAFDFEAWAAGKDLPNSPFIFINACQGGQMQTMFYKSFAVELLRQGAAGLVGAQIDVPAVFAAEYARQVLEKFFSKGKDRVRMGPLLREVNQNMWDTHNNPLGLVYSLYRGVNCFIDWPESDRQAPGPPPSPA
jgi:Peptidase family C25